MANSLLILFLVSAGVIGMLAAIILIFINTNNKVTRFLGFHLAIVSFEALYIASWLQQTILNLPHLYRLDHTLLMLNAPALYFYLREVFTEKKFSLKREFWHLLPALVIFIYHIPDYFVSASEKHNLIDNFLKISHAVPVDLRPEELCIVAIVVSGVVYSYLNWRLYRNNLIQNENAQVRLAAFVKWIKIFMKIGLFNVTIFVLATFFVEANVLSNHFVQIILGVHILTISFTLFTNPHVLYGINEPFSLLRAIEFEKGKAKTILTLAQKDNYLTILKDYFAKNPYLKKNYSQKTMSSETNIPVHHISFLINEHFGMNYNDFVNKLRIEFVLNNAEKGRWNNYSIEGIAHEVGFKSKTTFITSFKKITGTTPSNYLLNNREDNTYKQ